MQYTLLTAALGLASVSSASTISHAARGSSLVRLPITALPKASLLSKRQNDVNLTNEYGAYYLINFHIGTPPQPVSLSLDTGSNALWVNPECATSGAEQFCEGFPQFNADASTSLTREGTQMSVTYGQGSAQGVFVKDVVTIGNAKVTNQEIGIAQTSEDWPVGIMGISPLIPAAGNSQQPTVVGNMAAEGLINSQAFSLDLRDVQDPDGSIIFGGIDTNKYQGALQKLPIIPTALTPDRIPRYWVYMNSVGITKPGQATKKYPSTGGASGQPVFLDSGSTISILPGTLVDDILADFPGATYDQTTNLYVVDCSFASQDGTMDFGFGNTVIHVPFAQFIWNNGVTCNLGVHKDSSNPDLVLLGDSFLRSAYVVYDQDNQNLHVAQADNCGTNLVEIGKGPDAVPSIIGNCGKTVGSTTTTHSKTTSSSKATSTSSPATTTGSPVTTPVPVSTYPAVSYPLGNSTASGSISTVYSTTVYTISSCAPTVTNCPYGHVTTEVISQYTTYCPEAATTTSPVAVATGSVYPIQPSSTPLPTFTGSAGKATASVVAAIVAGIAVIAML